MLSGFSREHGYHHCHLAPKDSVYCHASAPRVDLPARRIPLRFNALFRQCADVSLLRLHIAVPEGNGILTVCPSPVPCGYGLGPDLPRADQLYSGNLRYSAGRIPTFLSLLIPAFSLLIPPLLLTGTASSVLRMLLYHSLRSPRLRCCVSAPDIFGAGTLD